MFKEIPRVDVKAKITGSAKYADDMIFPKMVYGAMVRSSIAHGDILSIDTKEALKQEGVLSVITYDDIPGIAGKDKERPVLAKKRVRFVGDGIAIVVASSQQIARSAAAKVVVRYNEIPAVFDPSEAILDKLPAIHGDSNLEKTITMHHGDTEKGWNEADVIVEQEVCTHRVQHAAIEPESAVAVWQEDHLELYCPPKSPFNVRRVVSETLGLSVNKVRLISSTVGGSFGGKDYDMSLLGSRVALVSRLSGRPAKMTYNREESITECTKRHPYKMQYKIGAKKDGTLTGLQVDILSDAGAYLSKSAMVGWRSCVESSGPYLIPNIHTDVKVVYTNQIYSDSLRGFGSPQVDYGIEVVMDKLAEKLGMDPLLLRRKNALKDGDEHATGQILTGVSMKECLDKLEEASKYEETKIRIDNFNKKQTGPLRRGFGIAALHRGEALGAGGEGIDTAGVNVHIEKDGSVLIYCGLSEVGQGCQTMMVRIVSEMLGINPSRCRVSKLDTDYVPDSGPTVASRGTVIAGNATVMAVEIIKEKIHKALAGQKWFKNNAELVYEGEKIRLKDNPEIEVSFDEAVKMTFSNCDNLYGNGWWAAPKLVWDWEKGQGDAYFNYVYGACGCEVEVDLDSGKTKIIRFIAVHDVGTALNIEEVYGQICGGVAMGIGYALMEEVKLRDGQIQNTNLDSYLLPTAMDIGQIEPVIVQDHSAIGPLGAKGLGEPVTSIVAPAITNAISDALGTRIYELPADLEHVLAASRREE
ncbi:xanthine dehydrogenase family protein [Clostridia bacterium]|nr:xanthine dehydrogenase family protein [Clostridia bacterium]